MLRSAFRSRSSTARTPSDPPRALPQQQRQRLRPARSRARPHRRRRKAPMKPTGNRPRRAKIIALGRETGALVLDPRNPMQAARALVAARFVNDDHRLLHRHRGTFWRFQVNHYAFADQETVRAEVWTFLEQAQRRGQGNKLVPFKPNPARVSDVLHALASACSLDNRIDPPTWLTGANQLPAAADMFRLANGLLHLPSGELYPLTADYFRLTASHVA